MRKTWLFFLITILVVSVSLTFACKGTAAETTTAETTAAETTAAETTAAEAEAEKPVFALALCQVGDFMTQIQKGWEYAGEIFNFEAVTEYPSKFEVGAQTDIINALLARGDVKYLIIQPVDPEGIIPIAEKAYNMGIPVATTGSFLGDGIYYPGHPVTFPVTAIGSDNMDAGRQAGEALAKAIDYKGKVYIQSWSATSGTAIQRVAGFQEVMEKYEDIEVVGIDYNDTDIGKGSSQMSALLQRVPDVNAVYGPNTHCVIAVSTAIKNAGLENDIYFVGIDSPAEIIPGLEDGSVDAIFAQKPYEWGIMSGIIANAVNNGVELITKRIVVSTVEINTENFKDPDIDRWIYGKK